MTPAPSEQEDEAFLEERAVEYSERHHSSLMDSNSPECRPPMNKEFRGRTYDAYKAGGMKMLAHARRTQAERMIRLQNANDGLKKVVSHYFAEIERLKRENAELKDIRDADTIRLEDRAAEIKKFREALEDMVDCVPGTEMYFAARDRAKIVLEDYAKLTSNAAQGERDDKQAD